MPRATLGSPWSRCTLLAGGDQRKFDEAAVSGAMVYALSGLAIIGRLGPEDVGHEGLRVAVVEREPARLDLHHDAMAGQEDVVGVGEIEAIEKRFVGGDGFGSFKAFAVAPT